MAVATEPREEPSRKWWGRMAWKAWSLIVGGVTVLIAIGSLAGLVDVWELMVRWGVTDFVVGAATSLTVAWVAVAIAALGLLILWLHGRKMLGARDAELVSLRQTHADEMTSVTDCHGVEMANLREEHDRELTRLKAEHAAEVSAISTEHAGELDRVREESSAAVARRPREVAADIGQATRLLGGLVQGGATREGIEGLPGEKYFRRAWADDLVTIYERMTTAVEPIYDAELGSALETLQGSIGAYEESLGNYDMVYNEGTRHFDLQVRRFDDEKAYYDFLRGQRGLRHELLRDLKKVDLRLYELRVELGEVQDGGV